MQKNNFNYSKKYTLNFSFVTILMVRPVYLCCNFSVSKSKNTAFTVSNQIGKSWNPLSRISNPLSRKLFQTVFPIGSLTREFSIMTPRSLSSFMEKPLGIVDCFIAQSKSCVKANILRGACLLAKRKKSDTSQFIFHSTINFMKTAKWGCYQFSTTSLYYEHYKRIICPDMVLKQEITSISELPKINKILLNTTSKKMVNDKKNILPGLSALELISGQKLKWTLAKKAIASFKLRKNQLIGCKVTLRKNQMYSFLEKLIIIVLPRIRDYNGFHITRIQNTQNLSLGLSNLLISPELENHFEYFEFFHGMTVTFVILTKNKYSAILLLSGFQFPIK